MPRALLPQIGALFERCHSRCFNAYAIREFDPIKIQVAQAEHAPCGRSVRRGHTRRRQFLTVFGLAPFLPELIEGSALVHEGFDKFTPSGFR